MKALDRGFQIGVIVTLSLSILFLIVSISTNYWRSQDLANGQKKHEGLWKACESNDGNTTCHRIFKAADDCVPASFAAAIAMMLISILFLIIGMALNVAGFCVDKSLTILVMCALVLSVAAGITGLAVYDVYYNKNSFSLDWSYALGWTGVAFNFIGLIIYIVSLFWEKCCK